MKLKLLVQTQDFVHYDASKEREAQDVHSIICIDMSQPPEYRMTETIAYRLKPSEVPKYWDKSMDKVLEVVCRRMVHSKAGRAMLIGEIVEEKPAVK